MKIATVTFQDIFKSSFTENIASFSVMDTAIAMILAFCIGLFIFMVYRKTFNGVLYSTSFGVSLMAMTLITTFVILAVTSNVVLSLGMVGALSIVRFRTAVKEPLDRVFVLGNRFRYCVGCRDDSAGGDRHSFNWGINAGICES